MAFETATTETESAPRRRWATWVAVLLLLALVAIVVLHPGLRGLAGDTMREMLSISPVFLALIVVFKVLQSLFSALAWRNVLLAAWPRADLSYRFVLGVEQGQVAINTVLPARAGTWAMLGIFGLSIRGARPPKLLAVWGVQNLAFLFFALANYTLLAIGLPEQAQQSGGVTDRVSSFASAQPLLTAGIAAMIAILLLAVAFVARRKIDRIRQQVLEGLAILRPPARYFRLLFLPSLASFVFSCASYVVLLAAFEIPVTIWTLALALGSNTLAGAVRVTPGGFGTTQAIDVIALSSYAGPEVVTAYSLSEIAITAVASSGIAVVALLSVSGWRGSRALLLNLHRGELAASMHTLGARRRALQERAFRRRRATRGK
ncbi:MAG: lysylphosphatidylglycerol synthase domain-containing protein [Thermomicrobiales bacterium]